MRNRKFISLLARLVPPRREFIVRSAGRVRYVGVGRFGQISFIILATLTVIWVGYSSSRYVSNALVAAERNVRIATSDRVIRNMQEEIDNLSRDLERGVRSLNQHATANEEIAGQNSTFRFKIASLELERDELIQFRGARDLEIAALNEELAKSAEGSEGLNRQLGAAEERFAEDRAERDQLSAKIDSDGNEIARLNGEISRLTGEQADIANELKVTELELQATDEERARVIAERGELNDRVANLSDRLELFAASQAESIDRLGAGTDMGISALERTLAVAGLDIPLMLDRVLGENSGFADGVGGPLVALDDEPGSETGEKLATVELGLLKLQGLQGLMKHLPFAAPLNEYRVTSNFGRRRDPFTNRLAMHPGLDFASRNKNPVHVTAPGTVAFVGWKGGYGKVVEIDHGFGIRTRFAHLSRIYVKRRQKLEFREKVGLVGSTGRSTAPHLHYEVMVDGQPLDPANFLRAGQYVFKN
jgi:murein DD-endopeptidase MepM/ murein hydrolase activator NlpD